MGHTSAKRPIHQTRPESSRQTRIARKPSNIDRLQPVHNQNNNEQDTETVHQKISCILETCSSPDLFFFLNNLGILKQEAKYNRNAPYGFNFT